MYFFLGDHDLDQVYLPIDSKFVSRHFVFWAVDHNMSRCLAVVSAEADGGGVTWSSSSVMLVADATQLLHRLGTARRHIAAFPGCLSGSIAVVFSL